MRSFCQCCGNGCNNSQHSWPITGVGLSRDFIALLSLRRTSVMHVHGPDNVDGRAACANESRLGFYLTLLNLRENKDKLPC